eukprot:scaffold179468_cov33-Tisochrysis_lutea.AAC.2
MSPCPSRRSGKSRRSRWRCCPTRSQCSFVTSRGRVEDLGYAAGLAVVARRTRSLCFALRSDDWRACATPSFKTSNLEPIFWKRDPSCLATASRVTATATGWSEESVKRRARRPC